MTYVFTIKSKEAPHCALMKRLSETFNFTVILMSVIAFKWRIHLRIKVITLDVQYTDHNAVLC